MVLLCGCAGNRNGTLSDGIYRDEEATYRLEGSLSEAWQPVTMGSNDLAWRHPKWNAVIQVNSSCDPAQDIPLVALTKHLLIGFTDRAIAHQQRIPLDGREALQTHVRAELDGVPRELLITVLKKNACVYDFVLAAPPGQGFDEARVHYQALVAGFHTEHAAI